MFKFEFKVNVIDSSVEPSDHPVNSYPSSGVAVIVTSVPCEKVPPPVTDPPTPAVAVKVYCLTICAGGVFGASESSLAQVNNKNKLKKRNSFFTFKFINLK